MKKLLLALSLVMFSMASFADGSFDQITQDNLGTYNPLGGAWIYKGNIEGTFNNQFSFHTEEDMNLETTISSYWGTITNFQSSIDGHALSDNHGVLYLTAGDHTFDVRGHSGLYGSGYNADIHVSPVPEPETWAMLLAGLGLLGFMVRRRA